MNQFFLIALSLISLASTVAYAEAYPVYKFHLEEKGLIQASCQIGKEDLTSKINFHPIPEGSNENFVKTHLKFKLCLSSTHRRKESFSLYLPAFVYSEKKLTQLKVGEKKKFSNLPSTQRVGDSVDIELLRLAEQTLKFKGEKIKVYPFQLTWLPQAHQSRPEYPPMKFYLTDRTWAKKAIPGFQKEMNPWVRLEIVVELFIGPDLAMHGNLERVAIEGSR